MNEFLLSVYVPGCLFVIKLYSNHSLILQFFSDSHKTWHTVFYIGAITAGTARCRSIMDLRPRDHVSSALRQLHWLPIKQRIEFKLCLLVHKSLIGHSPAYISDLLTPAADVPGRPALWTASRGDFIVPRTNRKFGDRAFCVAALRVWNRLPADLRQLRSTQTFRRHLKTFLFAASYWAPINKTFMDYVMRRRSTVGGTLEMFSLPLRANTHKKNSGTDFRNFFKIF